METSLTDQAIVAQLIAIEKDLRKLTECMMVILQQTIQGNKLAKKNLFLQFNVKDLTDIELNEEYVKVRKILESKSDEVKDLSNKLMLGKPE